jgi:hypothetical protein
MVRIVFQENLGIPKDEFVIAHEPADEANIRDYNQSEGSGPDRNDLHLDINGTARSFWNQKVFRILVEKLKEKFKESEHPLDVYLLELCEEKFGRLKVAWNRTKPRQVAGGRVETIEDVEQRLIGDSETLSKIRRQNTRRIHVSDNSPTTHSNPSF